MTEITSAEVKKHKSKKSVWIVIHNDVYDVTKFLNEHPGGADSLMSVAGKDGTQEFEDVGHSDDARTLMKKFKIGRLPAKERSKFIPECPDRKSLKPKGSFDPKHKDTSSKVERRKNNIIVPKESSSLTKSGKKNKQSGRKKDGSPSSNWWKWALLVLAGALVVGATYKKFAT